MRVLVVEDDLALAGVLSYSLRQEGYEVVAAHDGLTAIEKWQSEAPDLIILDLNLPRLDGLAVCRQVRAQTDIPIIILSVRDKEDDVVLGLELGADDYVVKPFSPRELLARVKAALRRTDGAVIPGPISAAGLTLERERLELHGVDAEPIQLSVLEARLLEALMLDAGHVLPADALITAVWGPHDADRTILKQLVYRLRRKLEPDPSHPVYIETVPGVGYAFAAERPAFHDED
jgi:DNA-binding response OmpR family regulator